MCSDEESTHEVQCCPFDVLEAQQKDSISILDEYITKKNDSSGNHSKDDIDDEETFGLGLEEFLVES